MDKKTETSNEINVSSKYWQNVEDKNYELENLKNEFPEDIFDVGMAQKGRRDFLKIMGFSLSVLPVMSSCRQIPKQKALPYLEKSDQVIPGVANWYATTNGHCPSATPLLVKAREGRPIKVEGNSKSPLSRGGVSPACQASVLSLYDSSRYKTPMKKGEYSNYKTIDSEIMAGLNQSRNQGKRIALVLSSIYGPSQKSVVERFQNHFGNVDIIQYNPFAKSTQVKAVEEVFGQRDALEYNLENADIVLGISADFLATGIYPISLTKQYSARKAVSENPDILRHIQVEGRMSLTGTNSDKRIVLSSSEESIFINNLLRQIQVLTNTSLVPVQFIDFEHEAEVKKVANELVAKRGKSAVIYGGDRLADAVKVNTINHILDNMNKTVMLSARSYVSYEDDQAFQNFVNHSAQGRYSHVIFYDVNPFYDYFDQAGLQEAMNRVPTKISLAGAPDETSEACDYVSPDRHYLEKWDDFEHARGIFTFSQPVIQSIFNNRSAQDTLLTWTGYQGKYRDYVQNLWETRLQRELGHQGRFREFWAQCIHDGIVEHANPSVRPAVRFSLRNPGRFSEALRVNNELEVQLYQKIGMHKGKFANNPWLQEMPDPVTKATWDNYLLVSPQYARENKLKTGAVVKLKAQGKELKLPVLVQPGMGKNVFAVAMGYGRTVSGKAGKNVGVNAFPFASLDARNGQFRSVASVESIERTSENYDIALTQTHHSLEGRDIVKETVLGEYKKNPSSGNETGVHLYSMWTPHKKEGYQWGMAIDLNKCTGCSACIVSCNAENNVPVVGKDEVFRRREMHWIRIDRYYSGDDANPETVYQPMTCQHCDNAPCETVCPTLATVQSSEGLNQQVYNRCVGTRYCANNCPYKVRRFNWFNYAQDSRLENMVLNPDITVRHRGVMEKCTMCIQRIQEKRILSRNENRQIREGEVKTACQQSCPGDAIVFGDLNNPESEIAKKVQDPRYYRAIEELGIAPRVGYMTKVRNKTREEQQA